MRSETRAGGPEVMVRSRDFTLSLMETTEKRDEIYVLKGSLLLPRGGQTIGEGAGRKEGGGREEGD